MARIFERGDVVWHEHYKALGVICGFYDHSGPDQHYHNVLLNWISAPATLYFSHAGGYPACHYDAGDETQHASKNLEIVGRIEVNND